MSDAFTTSAGPYVLGALSPAERDAFEQHLAACPACRSAVEDLAVLPGLLARVPLEAVADGPDGARADPGPPPPALLDGLLLRVRRERRRRRWWSGAVAAAAACAVLAAVLTGLFGGGADGGSGGGADGGRDGGSVGVVAASQTMRAVVPVPLSATVGLEPVAWGTRVDLACAYAATAGDDAGPDGRTYALTVTDRAGRTQTIGTWVGRPGREAVLQAATSVPRAQISVVEVRADDGRPLLRLDTGTA